jgi:RNA polymerase sigma-70 factor, ECF subfamily
MKYTFQSMFSALLCSISREENNEERSAIPMQATLPVSTLVESPRYGQEFQTLYQNRFRLIYRYVYSKVGNREEAEDLTSEIFLKAARGIDQERSQESMQQWLFYIARTTIADYWRGYYRHPKSSLEELVEVGWDVPDEESSFETNSVAADRVQRILQALPEQQREVLRCRFLLRLSIKATALKMGVSIANAKVLQYRALRRASTLE